MTLIGTWSVEASEDLGRRLADHLKVPFIQLVNELEKLGGMPVSEILCRDIDADIHLRLFGRFINLRRARILER